jgi:ATP-dependent DNA helicase RecG
MGISILLASSEGKTLEFKWDLSSSKPILKTLVAFANTAGGTLIIGRGDDGSIVGVDDVQVDEERLEA